MNAINQKTISISIFKLVLPLFVLLFIQVAVNAQSYTPEEQNCFNLVQGKVAWDKAGNSKVWIESNVRALCKGTKNPTATITCFKNIVSINGDYGRGIRECPSASNAASPAEPRKFPETYRSPGEIFKGATRRTFDQYAWLTSHNSFVNYSDARWTTPNQSRGIIGQIETNGVRGLMLDIYDFEGIGNFGGGVVCGLSAGSDCYDPGIYMCHGGCRGFPGVTYALPRQNLKDTLNGIADWLSKNRELKDVITIFFEDYTSGGTLAKVIKNSKVASYIFNPYGEWKVTEKGFPTLEYMQAKNQRLIIFTSKSENKDTSLGIAHDQDFNVENYWSIGAGGANYECKSRWGSIPLNTSGSNFKRLFVMNHFRDVPNTGTVTFDNQENNLKDRLTRCKTAAGRLPNFLALDFIELGSGKTLVDSINAEWEKQVSP